jgi:hypothetical protein
MILLVLLSVVAVVLAKSIPDPAQYCKEYAPPEFFNACVVCAANGSFEPAGDGRICMCKTIMSGFFGPPPYESFGECMQDFK